MQPYNNKIDATLLGKITLARFLALPLRAFDRLVTETESCTEFFALSPWVTAGSVTGTRVAGDAYDSLPTQAAAVLGQVREVDHRLIFIYQRDSYAREYQFDEGGVARLASQPDCSTKLASILCRLRLINTRNRLTHALMQAALASQAAYLRSGQPLMLVPLTQAAISARLRSTATLSVVADPGRISRLARGLSITLPNSQEVPLSTLFAKPRQVHRHFVDHMIKKETAWMFQGLLHQPLTDETIAAILERDYGVHLSRRTIANVRHDLAIPDCRSRSLRMHYLAATEGFSALVPLTTQVLRASVPVHSGVYEIRTTFTSRSSEEKDLCAEKNVPPKQHSVLYIGSTANLRKRLGDHLRGNSDNTLLYKHIADGAARVRFRLISDGWRLVERDLYRVFCETFGAPPPCNRMSP
ncbi:MAG: hypothetical protein HHJ12_05625 [Glaciimonas sp.]|nr:hypothetical protein [Glaciimonas sp.]